MRCRGLHGFANPAFLGNFSFSTLPHVAPYCVPGGVRVVSRGRRLHVVDTYSLGARRIVSRMVVKLTMGVTMTTETNSAAKDLHAAHR
jgi:hypothetical protein